MVSFKSYGVARIPIIAAVSLFFLSGIAHAQSLAGVVRDASGALLPGVTVEARSPALIERARVVVTDERGQYQIIDLRPGTYALTFTLSGFATVRLEAINVTGGGVTSLNAEMRVGS